MTILERVPLGFPWKTWDPFLFCVHHLDRYPEGDARMAPKASLAGRRLGMDFDGKDGWSMYHGEVVPGFPAHPHRGFETVTIARRGYIDHADSLGATARFGHGDVQWVTAGSGIVHSEMFPLVREDAPNPTELFQIWLNLPRASKMVAPHFTMLWSEQIPRLVEDGVDVAVVAGAIGEHRPPSPPPDSWAAREDADVAIFTLKLAPGASFTLPPARPGTNRAVYFFGGESLRLGDEALALGSGARVTPDEALTLSNGGAEAEVLVLQGRPIGEPVVQHGPFVMNSRQEIQQTFLDYQRTRFGGWPWDDDAPVHPRDRGRFAIHADGSEEHADG